MSIDKLKKEIAAERVIKEAEDAKEKEEKRDNPMAFSSKDKFWEET